ncbi:uncharacterized protein LOC132175435 isoform X2 [Corylus avellana]|uniref:uncharacterized protein LOC132175435 isoform X2 n=1 Tax=Corylus avellana TaxID=13451 RepID=UPI00286B6EB0|nr:uncharacterized protein LOC132175435 isoform X2 [Corylus avellana]
MFIFQLSQDCRISIKTMLLQLLLLQRRGEQLVDIACDPELVKLAIIAGTSSHPCTFRKQEAEYEEEASEEEGSQKGFEEESEGNNEKLKGTQGIIQIENPNLVKPKSLKARDIDLGKTTELSRREREEIEKQKAHERYMKLQEQGKTEQAKKD